ncbi:hypothetical protein CVT25_013943 [Psilocybe cyanescens]|uniref:Uncharacterized protein n=1 Tax=Psilocybe cyanescens TaxID=93625 RepID=A0A409XJU9_PSICY|nr:hypothetical protein CVT25_013943 [Psilocybe cyanescens]
MIPRFSNPHSLPQVFKTVPRAELYHDDDNDISFTHNEAVAAELYQLLAQSIEVIQCEPYVYGASPRKNKKRKRAESDIQEENHAEEPEEPQLFRLVSSVLPPLPVSLLPPPLPPSITREPDAEDSELQAAVRRERAQAASVDAEAILRQSKIIEVLRNGRQSFTWKGILTSVLIWQPSISSGTSAKSKIINLRAKLRDSSPPVMVVRTTQTPRKTRPPVESSKLVQFPYTPDISTLSVEPIKSRTMDCPSINAESTYIDASTAHRRSRRRRKTSIQDKKRPIPQFWRPSPSLTGKCRGYAYGYPGYLASATGSMRVKYTRDRMKNGVHVDSI